MVLAEEQYAAYKKSYVYRNNQRFNTQNILKPFQLGQQYSKRVGVHRDRLYYLENEEEIENVLTNDPGQLEKVVGIPEDLHH